MYIYIYIYIRKFLFFQTLLFISIIWALSPFCLINFFTGKLMTIVIVESTHFRH